MLRHNAHRQRLRALRDARGWTQEQLAIAAGYRVKAC